MIQRMIRAALLDATLYEELRDDPVATLQAFGVVVLGGIALAVGGGGVVGGELSFGKLLLALALYMSVAAIQWFVLSLLAYWVGKRLLGRTFTFPYALRSVGYANVPWILSIFVFFVPALAGLIVVVVLILVALALATALRQTLQVSWLAGILLAVVGVFLVLSIPQLIA